MDQKTINLPNPDAISVGLFILEEAIKLEPAIATAIRDMFNKGVPTAQDWADLRAWVAGRSYRVVVPNSQLTAEEIAAAEAEEAAEPAHVPMAAITTVQPMGPPAA